MCTTTTPAALTGDESRADDDVHLLTLLGEQLHLRLDELLGHFLGVAALALSRLFAVHLQRLGTQRLELLQGCGPGGGGGRGIIYLVKLGGEHTLQQIYETRLITDKSMHHLKSSTGWGKLRPWGHLWPVKPFNPAR